MQVVILAGGFGTRLAEETDVRPKPMVEIGGMPILWHIMKIYSSYGYNDFVVCLGYKGYIIKEYFANLFLHHSDVTIDVKNNKLEVHNNFAEDWKITLADKFKEDQGEVTREWRKFAGYPPAVQSMSPEIQRKIIKGNRIRKLQEVDPVWQEVIKWVLEGKAPKLIEVRGKVQEVLTVRQLFNPILFCLNNGVLCYNRHTDPTKPYDAKRICIPESKLREAFQICHEGLAAGHRGVNGTLDKFQRTFFTLSARDKIRRLVERCDVCLTKERSIKNKMGPHVPSTVGNVGEKVFIDLVSMSETVRKNRYLLTVQDGFTRFASAYPICNKEAGTVARVLIREHFSVYGLPNQIHSDNGGEFVNQLWQELFAELKILHTKTPPYNPSSNIIERWHRTIVGILRTMGQAMQSDWDLGVKAACLAYNTTVHTSTGQTPFFATFGREATVPVHWIYPTPKPDREMELSDWTETMQERFQQAYSGMREQQQKMIRRNAQYYKPIMSKFEVGDWVWIFDPRIIPGSCNKLRSYWAGPYKIIRKLAPALAEVIEVYEKGKPRIVSVDIIKEFRGENGLYGYPSDPPHPQIVLEDEIREIPNLENTPPAQESIIKTPDLSKYEAAAKQNSNYSNTADNREEGRLTTEEGGGRVNPSIHSGGNVEMGEEHLSTEVTTEMKEAEISGTTVDMGEERIEQTVPLIIDPAARDTAARLEERETMETEIKQDVLKRQGTEIQGETKRRHREGIKRSRRSRPEVAYEELEDDLDELDEPKRCRWNINCISTPCNCKETTQPMRRQETSVGWGTVHSREGGNREEQSVNAAEEGGTVPPAREHGGAAAATTAQELNTNHQSYKTPRRKRNSLVAYLMKMGILLLMLLAGVEGTTRWKEINPHEEIVTCHSNYHIMLETQGLTGKIYDINGLINSTESHRREILESWNPCGLVTKEISILKRVHANGSSSQICSPRDSDCNNSCNVRVDSNFSCSDKSSHASFMDSGIQKAKNKCEAIFMDLGMLGWIKLEERKESGVAVARRNRLLQDVVAKMLKMDMFKSILQHFLPSPICNIIPIWFSSKSTNMIINCKYSCDPSGQFIYL